MKARVLLLALLVALPALGAPRRKKPRAERKPRAVQGTTRLPGVGQVTSVTAELAFLDRGAEDGLAVGAKVQLLRGGRQGAVCEVQAVGPHVAACKAGAVKPGDRFTVERKAAPPTPRLAAPPPGPDELARRRERVEAEPMPLREFDRQAGPRVEGLSATVALGHASWAGLSSPDAVFHQERLDASFRAQGLLGGLWAGVDLSALYWTRRSAAFRSPHTAAAQLLVREAFVGWRFRQGFGARLGRFVPLRAPGAALVDGAELGWLSPAGRLSVGVYGGALPDPVTLTPLRAPFTAGAFVSARFGGATAQVGLVEPALRVAWVGRPGVGNRIEADAALRAFWGTRFDGRLEVAAGFGDGAAPAMLDAVRLDLGLRPLDALRVRVGGRYSGGGDLWLGSAPIQPSQAIHADGAASWELPAGFVATVQGGAVKDLRTGLLQGRVGPELGLPAFAWGRLGAALGYDEEFGWLPGRSGYVRLSAWPVPRFALHVRASVFHQTYADEVEGMSGLDGGLSFALDARLFAWLWLRASGMGRIGFTAADRPGALSGQLALGGTL